MADSKNKPGTSQPGTSRPAEPKGHEYDYLVHWKSMSIEQLLLVVPIDDILPLFDQYYGVTEEELAQRSKKARDNQSRKTTTNQEHKTRPSEEKQGETHTLAQEGNEQRNPSSSTSMFSKLETLKLVDDHSKLLETLPPTPLKEKVQRVNRLTTPPKIVKVIHLLIPKIPYIVKRDLDPPSPLSSSTSVNNQEYRDPTDVLPRDANPPTPPNPSSLSTLANNQDPAETRAGADIVTDDDEIVVTYSNFLSEGGKNKAKRDKSPPLSFFERFKLKPVTVRLTRLKMLVLRRSPRIRQLVYDAASASGKQKPASPTPTAIYKPPRAKKQKKLSYQKLHSQKAASSRKL